MNLIFFLYVCRAEPVLCKLLDRKHINKNKLRSFIQRTITGAVFVAVLLSCIYFGPYSFLILFSVIAILSLNEFYKLLRKEHRKSDWIQSLGGAYLLVCLYLTASHQLPGKTLLLLSPYLLFLLFTFISQLYTKREQPIYDWSISFMGQIYIALPLALLNFIAFPANESGTVGYAPLLVIAFFAFIWLNDTGAFLVGSAIGRHRLFERISPKKSWEGFFGGVFFAALGGAVFAQFSPILTLWEWIGLALVISFAGTWGDLCESLIKRNIHVKDSGHLLPGHGGMLDRFDSLFLASPAAIIYLACVWG